MIALSRRLPFACLTRHRTTMCLLLAVSTSLCAGCGNQPVFSGRPLAEWRTQLKDSNAEYRREALLAIGAIASRSNSAAKIIPDLATALNDSSKSNRMTAVEQIVATALERPGVIHEAIAALLAHITFNSTEETLEISVTVSRMANSITNLRRDQKFLPLVGVIRNTLLAPRNPATKLLALDMCRYIGEAELVGTIVHVVKGSDDSFIQDAAFEVVEVLASSAVPPFDASPFLTSLKDHDPITVRLSLIAISSTRSPPDSAIQNIVASLTQSLGRDESVVLQALQALSLFRSDDATVIPALVAVLSTKSDALQRYSIKLLVQFKEAANDAIQPLCIIASDTRNSNKLRLDAVNAIAIIDPQLEFVGAKQIREQLCQIANESKSSAFAKNSVEFLSFSEELYCAVRKIYESYPAIVEMPVVSIEELKEWSAAVQVRHPLGDMAQLKNTDQVKFHLGDDSPDGCSLDPLTGVVSWTPTEKQGPGKYRILVSTSMPPHTKRTDEISLTVIVREANSKPMFSDAAELFVGYGDTLRFHFDIEDVDIPRNKFSCRLTADAPAGAVLHEKEQVLTWTPTVGQCQKTWQIGVNVLDDGLPPLEATKSFRVRVGGPKLSPLVDATVNEMSTLRVGVQLAPPQTSGKGIVFSFLDFPPSGCVIDSVTGVVTWTPTEEQGPMVCTLRVGVKCDGAATISDEKKMQVLVKEVKRPIRVVQTPPQLLEFGATLRVQMNVIDEDIPRNPIRFQISGPPPVGFHISKETGALVWRPITEAGTWQVPITVRVIDANDMDAVHEIKFNVLCLAHRDSVKNENGMTLTHLPHDDFIMGLWDHAGANTEVMHAHAVRINQSFLLATTEVTQGQWTRIMGARVWPSGAGATDDYPASGVSWVEALEFCNKLSLLEGVEPFYPSKIGNGYRLPTEAEWEYACRGGADDKWCFGNEDAELSEYAWYDPTAKNHAHAVGTKRANRFGLYDMHGNVEEWCQAGVLGSLPGANIPSWVQVLLRTDSAAISKTDKENLAKFTEKLIPLSNSPTVKEADEKRVVRGGSWRTVSGGTASHARLLYSPVVKYASIGFRVCRTITFSKEDLKTDERK